MADDAMTAARAKAMRQKMQAQGGAGAAPVPAPAERAPGWNVADKLNALLPDFLSARSAVLRKRKRMEQIDQQMAEGEK